MEMRDYQINGINEIRAAFNSDIRKVCYVAPCGAGKGTMIAYMANMAADRGNKVLFLIHRIELLEQIQEDIGRKHPYIQLAMTQTIVRRLDKTVPPDIIICDECFVAGTMIGNVSIEQLKVGDMVPCFNELTGEIKQSKVINLFKNPLPDKLILLSVDDREINCTINHPIFTPDGWRRAGEIKAGDSIYVYLPKMWKRNENKKSSKMSSMLSIRYGNKKSKRSFKKNERKKSYVDARDKRKVNSYTSKDEFQTMYSRWKWSWFNRTAETTWRNFRLGNRICYRNKTKTRQWISTLLQSRHCKSKFKNCYRGRRRFAQFIKSSSTRQEENEFLAIARVDSIKIYQQRSNAGFNGVCQDSYVYNVEVETYNNYIANGIAVHNCHHGVANTWRKIFNYFPKAYLVGLTATPARTNGNGLSEICDKLIIGPSVSELIEQGFLAPYKYYAPPISLDLEGVKIKMGDYDQKEIAIRVDKPVITGQAIQHYKTLAEGKQAIIYCASIQHSKNTVDSFIEAGYKAKHVDGETSADERRKAIAEFKSGTLTIMSNVQLFGEGLNLPNVEVVILLRPTQSLVLHTQQSMRSMRPGLGKTAIIIDAVGNVFRHGLPTDIQEWSLEGIKKHKKSDPSLISLRQCLQCYSCHKPSDVCPYCGYVYPVTIRQLAEQAGELKELTVIEKKQKRMEVGMCRTQNEITAIAFERKYAKGWVKFTCESKKIRFSWKELNQEWDRLISLKGMK